MINIRSHFKFNKQERSGIFFLLLLIFCFQTVNFLIKSKTPSPDAVILVIDDKIQQEIHALKAQALEDNLVIKHRFNPNYIDDFRGYSLGMSPGEIDNFFRFRALGKYVNSPEEFQMASGISDVKLMEIAPYFRFPEWKNKTNEVAKTKKGVEQRNDIIYNLSDLNSASADELRTINGIGETLSNRIIKFRDALGGFLVNEQLYDVYGLKAEVVERTLKKFRIINKPTVNKVNINNSTAEELAFIIYINNDLARKMVAYRNQIGRFSSFDDLRAIPDFPSDKIERIKLYLSL
ncbi:ComEA family DNA-binding protein [Muriicola sp. Z0-33]|uniref:ComEA family DNA-binding protein n=1 Tax=Muriicola sp. Z0-33 TaxID=2816957 RepID=UPI0022388DE8|nr:helix-hairpin-helix domain-containing protein [Muriicola sp. Z0-33]MCW5517762.1 helix-hairpin-helix domain-containing protein [Muriicola sp. Z0-33]